MHQQLVDYAKGYVRPGLQYFLEKFSGELSGSVVAFKAARFFLPKKVVELKPDTAAVDSLQAFPFLNEASGNLKSKLPSYPAKAAVMNADIDPLDWWRNHSADLPYWSAAAADVLLVQPSSAAAERVLPAGRARSWS